MSATAVILAAGLGTRMKSARPKALHPIAGRPMLRHLIESCAEVFDRIVVVTGPGMAELAAAAAPHPVVVQEERLGTAHAARQAARLFGDRAVAVLYADNPLVRPQTLRRLLDRLQSGDVGLTLLAMRPPDPGRYGRVIRSGDYVRRVVEWADADADERGETLCNAGAFCAAAADMARWLAAVRPQRAGGEYYLTDVVGLAVGAGVRVAAVEAPFDELRGINSRAELAAAEATVQSWLRAAALDAGVTMTAPDTVFFAADTRLAADVTVAPYVVFGPGVTVGEGAEIRAFSHLEGCTVGAGAIVGPYARIRPGTAIGEGAHVGNFVELKAARLGRGAKANHLTYLGDAEVGAGANIGAGTITCNYDGIDKHRTVIGERAFIGSDTALVAPVTVGAGAITAAGSVIVRDVAPDALAIARGVQVEKPGRAAELFARKRKDSR
ncbi:MAG: bifunctional UDP-N-acetylglucosamine diphosphorylase/glucosamine-1-phosphate N-acetyltransferase GlmU [Alphaproteobacteria bacterium]|nr:bifunctional UDP-N-acetylglucosamine diphosphorylase/glucosamine-1-phosphate N-acetyltransferase GlmU [Alphaproteobacteria bacterium]